MKTKTTKKLTALKFNKFNVTNGEVTVKVYYSTTVRNGVPCVSLYQKDHGYELFKLLPDLCKNDTDIQTDYFCKTDAIIPEGHEHYAAALARTQQNDEDCKAKREAPKKVENFTVTSPAENVWETTVRGIKYKITYRFKPGYLMWLVQSANPNARLGLGKAKWVRTPDDIEVYFPRLRGIAAKIAPPENCVAFPAR